MILHLRRIIELILFSIHICSSDDIYYFIITNEHCKMKYLNIFSAFSEVENRTKYLRIIIIIDRSLLALALIYKWKLQYAKFYR